ncbi:hypothetical protein [Pleionea sp. CnH1-48]|uniref:hypothetical protein n=1 Tax=Pleionea sp. CnH1-48 TaxID=2954494 RepID=UPI002096E835|nr:hypothetical protein [Pleionea sp. CnH1-48]MCO7225031.1 hypothetical protein [Pleionea sp. CnH1-48]
MASWTKKPLLELLRKLNDVPFTDEREGRQLTILMAGLSDLNRQMMQRAAQGARKQISETQTYDDDTVEEAAPAQEAVEIEDFEAFDEELEMIEQTLIRSIGD